MLAWSSQAGAQQAESPLQTAVPVPDTSLPPPLTAKDIEARDTHSAPAVIKQEPKPDATAPSTEPAKAAAAPTAAPVSAADSGVAAKMAATLTGNPVAR